MTDVSPSTHDASFPDVQPRPALDRWLRDRSLTHADFAKQLGVSKQTVNDLCRPFVDPDRKGPSRRLMTKIVRSTNGGVRPEDFYPPVEDILRGVAA